MCFSSGNKVGKTDARGMIRIVWRIGRGEEMLHPHAVEWRSSMFAVELNTRGKKELLEDDVEILLEADERPCRGILFALNQIDGGLRIVADEGDVRTAEDAADFDGKMRPVRADPLPFNRQPEGLLRKGLLDPLRMIEGPALHVRLDVLRKDLCMEQMPGQRLPKEHIRVEMDEGLILKAVSKELSERPPTGIGMVELLECC